MSTELLKCLEYFFKQEHPVPEDQLPEWLTIERCEFMFEQGHLRKQTLVIPGTEVEFYGPRGLCGYLLSAAGRELLLQEQEAAAQAAKEKAEEKKGKRNDRIFQLFLTLLSFFLGLLAENRLGLIRFVQGIIDNWQQTMP